MFLSWSSLSLALYIYNSQYVLCRLGLAAGWLWRDEKKRARRSCLDNTKSKHIYEARAGVCTSGTLHLRLLLGRCCCFWCVCRFKCVWNCDDSKIKAERQVEVRDGAGTGWKLLHKITIIMRYGFRSCVCVCSTISINLIGKKHITREQKNTLADNT